jgi:hypothetical protein
MDPVNTVLQTTSASVPTSYIVSFFKLAVPKASSAAIVVVAVLAGLATSVLVTMMTTGIVLTQASIATVIVQGIFAAAVAAGITRTDQAGEGKRDAAKATPDAAKAQNA